MPHKDPAVKKIYHKAYYDKNRTLYLLRAMKQRAQPGHKEHIAPIKRHSMLKTRYGITDNDYHAMLAKQGGGCAICKTIFPNNGRGNAYFDVDHNHSTGKVRGLLCRDCNVTVGVIEKKTEKIKLIYEYLALHIEFQPEEPAKAAGV